MFVMKENKVKSQMKENETLKSTWQHSAFCSTLATPIFKFGMPLKKRIAQIFSVIKFCQCLNSSLVSYYQSGHANGISNLSFPVMAELSSQFKM